MTFISDRYDVYPVMDHPARATLDLYIVSICNDLAGKFDFLGKSSSFFRVIEPRDRRRMRAGFARSCGEAIWPALRCRQPCWGLSSLALLGPLLIGPVGGVPWFAFASIGVIGDLTPLPSTRYPLRGLPEEGPGGNRSSCPALVLLGRRVPGREDRSDNEKSPPTCPFRDELAGGDRG
jgi:hypothetical protein